MEKKYVYVSALVALVFLLCCSQGKEKNKAVVDSLSIASKQDSIKRAAETYSRKLDTLVAQLEKTFKDCTPLELTMFERMETYSGIQQWDCRGKVWIATIGELTKIEVLECTNQDQELDGIDTFTSYFFRNNELFSVLTYDMYYYDDEPGKRLFRIILLEKNGVTDNLSMPEQRYDIQMKNQSILDEYLASIKESLENTNPPEFDWLAWDEFEGNTVDLEPLLVDPSKVTTLAYAGKRLENVFKFSNLEILYLNGDYSTLPPEISNLTKLKKLNLEVNQFKSDDCFPSDLSGLSKLEWLNLNANQLGTFPIALTTIPSLQTLLLYGNPLKSIPADIAKLQNLTTLDLRETSLTEIPSSILVLKNLTRLNLRKNDITEIPDEITQLTNLKLIDLRDNKIPISKQFKIRKIFLEMNCEVAL